MTTQTPDQPLYRIRISKAIDTEYANRAPDFPGADKIEEDSVVLTGPELRAVLDDARYHVNPANFDIGPHDLPLPAFNAYGGLVRRCEAALQTNPGKAGQ